MIAATSAFAQSVSNLSLEQRRELTVFGIRGGLGLRVGPSDIKKVQSGSDLEKFVATGLNGNGLLCAQVESVYALTLKGKYEITCVAYRGGSGQMTYIVDALEGIAFEQ